MIKVTIQFEVIGNPFGKQRPRFRTGCKKPFTPSKTEAHENEIVWRYKEKYGCTKFPPAAPLGIRIIAYMPIPKSTAKYKLPDMISGKTRPTVTPDWDNIGKLVCDALNKVAYDDDRLICEAQVQKFYGETPKTIITVYTVE